MKVRIFKKIQPNQIHPCNYKENTEQNTQEKQKGEKKQCKACRKIFDNDWI